MCLSLIHQLFQSEPGLEEGLAHAKEGSLCKSATMSIIMTMIIVLITIRMNGSEILPRKDKFDENVKWRERNQSKECVCVKSHLNWMDDDGMASLTKNNSKPLTF